MMEDISCKKVATINRSLKANQPVYKTNRLIEYEGYLKLKEIISQKCEKVNIIRTRIRICVVFYK